MYSLGCRGKGLGFTDFPNGFGTAQDLDTPTRKLRDMWGFPEMKVPLGDHDNSGYSILRENPLNLYEPNCTLEKT